MFELKSYPAIRAAKATAVDAIQMALSTTMEEFVSQVTGHFRPS